MPPEPTRSLERMAFAALVALLLAPVVAHGLWRPMVHVFGPAGSAGPVTVAALAISAIMVVAHRLQPRRALVLSLAAGGLIAASATLGWSLGRPGAATLIIVAVVMAVLVRWLLPRLPASLDGLAHRHKLLTAVYLVVALASTASTARMSVFMGDPTRVDQQVLPGVAFLETHSCLTAYVRADTLSRQRVDNLYAAPWWQGSHGFPPRAAGVDDPYAPFLLDYYAYPPPFLLAMAPLATLDGDFPAQRALWFGLNGLLLAVGLWLVAGWLDGPRPATGRHPDGAAARRQAPSPFGGHRVLLTAPLFFGSLPVLATLQVGNFQLAVVVISVLAMVAFDQEREATGGALLAFAILCKLSPAILVITLLARRRWRSVAWTAGFGVGFLALSVAILGAGPLQAFVGYTLPRLGSGEAFGFLDDDPFSVVTNLSLFGLPFKLALLGVPVEHPWDVARVLGRGYTIILLVLAGVAMMRRGGERRTQAMTWMSLLVLSALQSPFAPGYVVIALLWAITLWTVDVRTWRGGVGLVLLWLALTVVAPGDSLWVAAAQSVLQSGLAIGVPIGLLVHAARRPARAPTA